MRVTTAGEAVTERFAPGSYCNLNSAEQLNRPPFDVLDAGLVLGGGPPVSSAALNDGRTIDLIVILPEADFIRVGMATALASVSALVAAGLRPPALSSTDALIRATRESWGTVPPTNFASYTSATAAHAFARWNDSGGAVPMADLAAPIDLSGV